MSSCPSGTCWSLHTTLHAVKNSGELCRNNTAPLHCTLCWIHAEKLMGKGWFCPHPEAKTKDIRALEISSQSGARMRWKRIGAIGGVVRVEKSRSSSFQSQPLHHRNSARIFLYVCRWSLAYVSKLSKLWLVHLSDPGWLTAFFRQGLAGSNLFLVLLWFASHLGLLRDGSV